MNDKDKLINFQAEAGAIAADQPPPQMTENAISVKQLTKKFRSETAVQDISFDIPYSTIFGFIGPSGSGKTTTIRLLTGIYRPTSGEISVLGRQPANFRRGERARIGYMPQLFVLYPNLTVWENINFAASLYGMSLIRGKQLKNALSFVELYDHRFELARNISGGMQRRLSLAATLVHNPDLIFLDEPTAGIDPILRAKFWDRFRELKSQGHTIFITTQYVSEAEHCDLVGVQNNGRLLMVDTPRGLRHHAYGGDMVDFRTEDVFSYQLENKLRDLPFVLPSTHRMDDHTMRVIVDQASTATPDLLEWAQNQDVKVKTIEEYLPNFEEVFVELVQREEPHG